MKKSTRFAALMMSVAMVASITGCDLPFGGKSGSKEDNAVTDAVASYMDNVIAGKYEKALKSVAEQEDDEAINISTMFDYLGGDQIEVVEALISSTEYEVKDVEVDDDEASCKLVLTIVDIEAVLDDLDEDSDIDDLIDAIEDSKDKKDEKIKLSLVNDDDWLLESDEDIANLYYDMVEEIGFEGATPVETTSGSGEIFVGDGEFSEAGVINYVDSCFLAMAIGDFSQFGADDTEAFAGMSINSPEFTSFLTTYFSYVEHETIINSIDVDNKTANVTINTTVPKAADLVSSLYNNHDFLVAMFAYSISGQELDFDNNPELASFFVDSMTAAIPNCATENLSATTVVTMDENGNYNMDDNSSDCLFGSTDGAAEPEMTDEETLALMVEAIQYAYDNGMIDEDTYNLYVDAFGNASVTPATTSTPVVIEGGVDTAAWPSADNSSYTDGMSYYEGDKLYALYLDSQDENKLVFKVMTWDYYSTDKVFNYQVAGPNINEADSVFSTTVDAEDNDTIYVTVSPDGGIVSGATYAILVMDADDSSIITVIYYEVK